MPDVPCGISVSMSNTMGMTVAAMSMITVPVTTGVKTRRSVGSQAASRNWTREETTIRLAIWAGPASTSAAMQTAMKVPEVPITRTWPAPNLQNLTACRMVLAPLMSSAANTPQDM